MSHPLHELKDQQRDAATPERQVWLSASAGTGKTQVLTARVLRLLMQPGVRPEAILCLTFTKAGATEMASRINEVLAAWATLDDARVAGDLKAIGAPIDPASVDKARTLFTKVLDAPGGGMRIQTIHSFAQSLLAAFPLEAGLAPGFRAIEERDRRLLVRRVLGEVVEQAESGGDEALLDAIKELGLRLGEGDAEKFIAGCASADGLWFGEDAWAGDLTPHVHALLGVEHAGEGLAALCADAAIDAVTLQECARSYAIWGTPKALEQADRIALWLTLSPEARLAGIEELAKAFFTAAGSPLSITNIEKKVPGYGDLQARACDKIGAVRDAVALAGYAAFVIRALTAGRAFAFAFADAKRAEGVMDFDDQIRVAARLLTTEHMAGWIRYKLDQRFDHILVDESQDTNIAQWLIVRGLADDFFAEQVGEDAPVRRTIFTVGDHKQAIFGFQGTSPVNYQAARLMFRALIALNERQELDELALFRSFRSVKPVLDVVDATFDALGHEAMGLEDAPPQHIGWSDPGGVVLWQPIGAEGEIEDIDDDGDDPDTWLSRPDRKLANRIAEQVKAWIEGGHWLHRQKRMATPGDVMILVRRRAELAGLIVARLHAQGVPVAGVDRLRVGAPLGVKDLLAALRFAVQPLDDLNLASLLVSPVIGWSQDDLLEYAPRDRYRSLWPHLRDRLDGDARLQPLYDILERADFEPPARFLEWLLSGPLQARAKLVARLGPEVVDPVEELVNAALLYERSHTPSLQGFLHWFDGNDDEIKREPGQGADEVRVMTVHGAKGLQAPIVILADATANPDANRPGAMLWKRDGAPDVPVPSPRKAEQVGAVADAVETRRTADAQEHWRLLYVAMTRAEEWLYCAGALGARAKQVAEGSWYKAIEHAMDGLRGTSDWEANAVWTARKRFAPDLPPPGEDKREGQGQRASVPVVIPDWLLTPVGEEPRPPRPLAPSSLGEDEIAADPPAIAPAAIRAAAERGTLMHRLFERLPELPAAERAAAARHWLATQAPGVVAAEADRMVGEVFAVIDDPRWAPLFGPDALAEAPIAAVVGERMVNGTIDRLLVTPDRIRFVDFKTARRPPASADAVPALHLRQMGAYAAALAAIFPGRAIEAGLLYTAGPSLVILPPDMLASAFGPANPG